MDSSKTLVQGQIRASDERSRRGGELLLGRYRLLERLGAGGFGTVWRAHDELLDRTVAFKRIPLPSEEDRERATREAHATARLAHPAIVALYEACSDEDAFYLISELIEGDTLAVLIAEDELSDEEVLEIGLTLTGALAHAHARGVIHRDVKPHNVLVPSERTDRTPGHAPTQVPAKLADFGGASLVGDEALTRTGDVLGTLAYMAPEQSEGQETGPACDLYSLALVLYEAFSGVNPVRGRTAAATARRIGAPIEPLERRRRDLPRLLTRTLDNALAADPASRGTLADLRGALEQALEREPRPRIFARRTVLRPRAEPLPLAEPMPRSPRERTREQSVRGRDFEDFHEPAAPGREHEEHPPRARHALALPRAVWVGCLLALAIWQAATGRPGVSLLVLSAGAPVLLLPRRSGPGWLAGALAPMLGLAGLAGAFPALAGQRADWRARAALGALGFWWLALAEPLLAKHLWLGPPSGLPPREAWETSFSSATTHVLGATLTLQLLLGTGVWALASMVLPWIVRGRGVALDLLGALVWSTALLAAVPLLQRGLLVQENETSPRGALIGGILGCALALGARALGGPV
jgi:eukaryotic-like serine/threonine-protein kinase